MLIIANIEQLEIRTPTVLVDGGFGLPSPKVSHKYLTQNMKFDSSDEGYYPYFHWSFDGSYVSTRTFDLNTQTSETVMFNLVNGCRKNITYGSIKWSPKRNEYIIRKGDSLQLIACH